MLDNIHDYGSKSHAKWSIDEFDSITNSSDIVARAESEVLEETYSSEEESDDDEDIADSDDDLETYGVKHSCPLNSLQAFHCTTSFPPDVLHDLFEGVISQDLLGVIRILSVKKWFTLEQYNSSMDNLNYKSYEATDKPQPVPLASKVKKLKGKACSNWLHIRMFPFIIRNFVKDIDDPVLELGLKLHEITERLTASEFKEYEVDVLEEKIIEYLDDRKKIYDDYPVIGSPKPKTHFLTHYPQAIRLFGPPLSYWTARYESRHRIAKNTAEASKNFKNISLTVSTRQMMRLSSVYYHGMFATSELLITDKISFKSSLSGKSDFEKSILPFMSEKDFLCAEIEINSQLYRNGQLVVLEMFSPDEMKIGLIVSILVKENSAYFVTNQYVAKRVPLQYFHAKSDDPTMAITDSSQILDYKPLINHGTPSHLFFCLHHHISYSYP